MKEKCFTKRSWEKKGKEGGFCKSPNTRLCRIAEHLRSGAGKFDDDYNCALMWLLSQFLKVNGVIFYLTSWKKDSWIKMGFTRKVNTTFLVFRAFLCQTTVIFKWRHKTWRGWKVFRGEFYAEAKSWREIPEISDTRLPARWRLLHCGQNICGRARFPEISSLHIAKIWQNSVN